MVVMVMAAVACYHKELFRNMTSVDPPAKIFPPIFLSNPSRFGKYLRMVIGCWITSNSVNILHVVPRFWHQSTKSNQQPEQSKNEPEIKNNTVITNLDAPLSQSTSSDSSEKKQECFISTQLNTPPSQDGPTIRDNKNRDAPSNNAENRKQYKCSECDLMFTRMSSLKRHRLKQHQLTTVTTHNSGNNICHDCGFKSYTSKELRNHLEKEHGMVFECETKLFESITGKFPIIC